MRQVTHALLTRPPLSHKNNHSEEIKLKCFVRLACVKHAASVHPEPGSNSPVKSLIGQSKLASRLFRNFSEFTVERVLISRLKRSPRILRFVSLNYTIDKVNCHVLFESFKVFHCLVINVRLLLFLRQLC